ncbi:MAG: tetratricopeptide repeat protein [Gemmatimonadales bacterium]|nr:tetratricopeptide repeat protein [Gemmatimonadales bacterium]
MRRPAKINIILMTLLAILCLTIFGQGINHGFTNLDDNLYVSANPELERGLSPSGLRWAFTNRQTNLWMPLTWISYLTDHQFFGPAPAAYHLTNILLHLMNTLLLFLVMGRFTGTLWRAGLVAALFAVHPLHVESVAWVAERKDVLSGFFFLLTVWFYLGYRRRPAIANYFAALFCFILSLMAKPMVVTLPIVLLLLDFWDQPIRRPLKRILLEKIPFLALAAALSVITFLLVQTREIGAPDPIPLSERLSQAVVFYTLYIGKMFWPTNLSVFYPPDSLQFSFSLILVSSMVLAAVMSATWRGRNRHRPVLIGWLWYVVMLLPVAGIVQGGMQLMSDRYFYLPSIGLFIALAWLLAWIAEIPRLRRVVQAVVLSGLLVATVSSIQQTRVWQSSETLYTHALKINAENYLAHMNLGVVLDDAGRSAEALHHLTRAVEIRKDAQHQFNLANALSHLGRNVEAIPFYRGAVRLQPDFPVAHNNLAISLVNTGDWDGAGRHFRIAIDQDPDYAGAHYNLGLVQLNTDRIKEAAECFRRALELAPDHRDAREQLQRLDAVDN